MAAAAAGLGLGGFCFCFNRMESLRDWRVTRAHANPSDTALPTVPANRSPRDPQAKVSRPPAPAPVPTLPTPAPPASPAPAARQALRDEVMLALVAGVDNAVERVAVHDLLDLDGWARAGVWPDGGGGGRGWHGARNGCTPVAGRRRRP